MEFPDYLAEEDPDIIVEQCVYDLTVSWLHQYLLQFNIGFYRSNILLHCSQVILNQHYVKKIFNVFFLYKIIQLNN
jgi:hypothetical protein